jgi:uncharacterized membrane protein YphA (DoxX/SURF4 family)
MDERNNTIEISLRVILGALFIWAGTMKVLDLDSFVESVGYFKIAPFDTKPWDMWLGYMLPVFEILVGTALILGIFLKGAMVSVLVMSGAFLIAVVSANMRGLNYECGCFGKALSFTNFYVHFAVLLVMTSMAAALCYLEAKKGTVIQGEEDQNKLA